MSGKLHPKASFADNAGPAITGRLDEMMDLAGALNDPAAVDDLHQLRIAAKRLRYAVEIFEPCLHGAKPVLRELSDLQDALGTIHDLDVLADILRRRLAILDERLEREAIEIMGSERSPREKSGLLQARLFAQARDPRRLGVLALLGDKIAERDTIFNESQGRWGAGGLQMLADRVRGLLDRGNGSDVTAADGYDPAVSDTAV